MKLNGMTFFSHAMDLFKSAGKTISKADVNLSNSTRIAVVGASRSGKTVLLTSLIDNLRNQDPSRFRIKASPLSGKDTARILKYEVLDVREGMTRFPFETFRKSLIEEACWPRKTKDTYQYRLKIYRNDSAFSRFTESSHSEYLSFLDFPGERIADAPMTSASYEDWSDVVLAELPSSNEFAPLIAAYSKMTKDPTASADEILDAYKAILAERLRQFHTAISPSSFALCPNGTTPERGMPTKAMIQSRFTGLSKDQQFCPLPPEVRKNRPELFKQFKDHFTQYKKQLIQPLYIALKDSDRLCILVNIPEILQSGVGAYNDHVHLLQQVIAYCSPRRRIYTDMLQAVTKTFGKILIDDRFRPGGIEKVAFVATQADRVRAEDMNRLTHLVHQLQTNSTRSLPHVGLQMEAFSCVAVQATKPAGPGHLQGRLLSETRQANEQRPKINEFSVSALPEEWPPQWDPHEFVFPDVWPKFNQNRNIPPEQTGLDRVFNYLIS